MEPAFGLRLAVCALFVALLQFAGGAPTVHWVSPRRGSLAGGTKVSLYGSGFSTDSYTAANYVFFGSIPCEVIAYTATASRLECVTAPYPGAVEGESYPRLQSRVLTSGGGSFTSTNADESFTYDWNYTPQLWEVFPNSGPVGATVEIGVYRANGDLNNYGHFFLGADNCNTRDPEKNQPYGISYRWPLHFVKVLPKEERVGGWNASTVVAGWRGTTWNHSGSLYPGHDWSLAMYEMYPDIHSVSPQLGSARGGTLLTITGQFGRTTTSAADVEVDVDGIPCRVLSVNSTVVRCWTGRPESASHPAVAVQDDLTGQLSHPATLAGHRFKGSRGVRFATYTGISGGSIDQLHAATDKYPHSPDFQGLYPSFRSQGLRKRNNYGERLSAFFSPHSSGDHTFFVASDDGGALWLTEGSNITEAENNRIVSTTTTAYENYYYRPEQRSSKMALSSDSDYLLIAEYKEGGGADFIQVGVLMHDSTDFTYSQTKQAERERQVVTLNTAGHYYTHSLHVVANRSSQTQDATSGLQIEWGGRVLDAPLLLADVENDTDRLASSVLSLFNGVCEFAFGSDPPLVTHYQSMVHSFEPREDDLDRWHGMTLGEYPRIVSDESYCGRHSLLIQSNGLNNSFGDSQRGFKVSNLPFLCLAVKLPQLHPALLGLEVENYGWQYVGMTPFSEGLPPGITIGYFNDYASSSLVDDDTWHYSCLDMEALLTVALGSGNVYTVRAFGFLEYSAVDPGFHIDEVSFTTGRRTVSTYTPPARPDGVALHDIVTSSTVSEEDGVVTLDIELTVIPTSCAHDFSPMTVTCVDLNEVVLECSSSQTQTASAPLAGSYRLSFEGQTTPTLSYDAPQELIELYLEQLPTVGKVTVLSRDPLPQDQLGLLCPGRQFHVVFETRPGDLDPLEVDSSQLTGDQLIITVADEVVGGLFLRPIPGHMLQTVEMTPQVHVRVRDQLAACSGGFDSYQELTSDQFRDFCAFNYSQTHAPTVTTIGPSTGNSGDIINIFGSGFNTDSSKNYVLFGDASCVIISSSETMIRCILGESQAGEKVLYLQSLPNGVADSDSIILEYTLVVESIEPATGSYAGGTELRIGGRSFADHDPETGTANLTPIAEYARAAFQSSCQQWATEVTVGNGTCEVSSSTFRTVVCKTPVSMNATEDTGDVAVDVSVAIVCTVPAATRTRRQSQNGNGRGNGRGNGNGGSQTTVPVAFTYSQEFTPVVLEVDPTHGSVQGGDTVTITAVGLTPSVTVTFGDAECVLHMFSEDPPTAMQTLLCFSPPAPAAGGGSVAVVISSDSGLADGDFSFTFTPVAVTHLGFCAGSLYGGQVMSISGRHFGLDREAVGVWFGGRACAVVTVGDGEIVCVTSSSARTHYVTNSGIHPEYGLGYQWTPSALTVAVGDTVHWSWTGSAFTTRRSVVQVAAAGETEYNGSGFRSGRNITGSFNLTFTTPGTYHYISEDYGDIGFGGVITVQDLSDIIAPASLTVSTFAVDMADPSITCGPNSETFSGSYIYSSAATPVIQSIDPRVVTSGDEITLTLHGIATDMDSNVFIFGGTPPLTCTASTNSVLSSTRTELDVQFETSRMTPFTLSSSSLETVLCTVPYLPAGEYRTALHVPTRGWGYADLESTVIEVKPRLHTSPAVSSGSLRGGLQVTIPTTGLQISDITRSRVDIGNTPCPVMRIAPDGILTCITGSAVDDGYSSIVDRSSPLAYWSLQADYHRSDGSYVESDGVTQFRSRGRLGNRANAAVFGEIGTRSTGISGNNVTDQSAYFQASFIETPNLAEFSRPAGFAIEFWMLLPAVVSKNRIITGSFSFENQIARGFVLLLNPCNQLEFWVASGLSFDATLPPTPGNCPPVNDINQCGSPTCFNYYRVVRDDDVMVYPPLGVWHVTKTSLDDWEDWHHVYFSWMASNQQVVTSAECTVENLCSGEKALYIDASTTDPDSTASDITYLHSPNTAIQIGGTGLVPLGLIAFESLFALHPFEGYLDEIAFHSEPLDASDLSMRNRYGLNEEQPVWVTVEGRNGIGNGAVPNVEYPEWDNGFTEETVVDWESGRDIDLVVAAPTAFRFEWTGLRAVRQVSREVFQSCDLEAAYVEQRVPTQRGGVATISLATGETYYFIDSVLGGCLDGRKIRIQVGSVEVVEWQLRVDYADRTITEGTGLLFQWNDGISHDVIELSSPGGFPSGCRFANPNNRHRLGRVVREWQAPPIMSGEVVVRGLGVGEHTFVCSVPSHCQLGMHITVTVVPQGGGGGGGGVMETAEDSAPYQHVIPWRIQTYQPLNITEGEAVHFTWLAFHSLHQVSEDVFESCDVSEEPLLVWREPSVDSSATIEGLLPGEYFFLCSVAGHCDAGMKIRVMVYPSDGVPVIGDPVVAMCGDTSGSCSFSYSAAATPQLFSITPTQSSSGATLTLEGRGLLDASSALPASAATTVSVLVENTPCADVTIVSSSTTEDMITCTITDYESRFYHVDVLVEGKGFASVDPTLLTPGAIRNETLSPSSLSPYPTFFLTATATSVSPIAGSLQGGTTVVISGSGFSLVSERLSVAFDDIPCRIISSNFMTITCVTGASQAYPILLADLVISVNGYPASTAVQFEYTEAATPVIDDIVSSMSVSEGEQIDIIGTNFLGVVRVQILQTGEEFDVTNTENSCTITMSTDVLIVCSLPEKPTGQYDVKVLTDLGFAVSEPPATVLYALQVDSFNPGFIGNGGGGVLTIMGSGFPYNTETVTVELCDSACEVVSASPTQVDCIIGPSNTVNPFSADRECLVEVEVNGLRVFSADMFFYQSALTPQLDLTFSPSRGGTAGGTIITLGGTGFLPSGVASGNLEEDDVIVTIDGAVCEWFSRNLPVTDTSIECRTSEHPLTNVESEVKVYVLGKGFAVSSQPLIFEYVDLWSSVFTWGGNPIPADGESVYIQAGQTVYLDVSTPVLNLVLIEGALVFQDDLNADLHFQAKYIFINTGKLQVGTEAAPFQGSARITLHGTVTDPEIPIYGAKVLAVRQGELDLHGRPTLTTWTRLAETAAAGDTTLQLLEAVDWPPGARIVIAPTGKNGNETEEHEVVSLTGGGRTITLARDLQFTHHGITDSYQDGHYIDIRAEVGLLSHNVVVEGSSVVGREGLGADQYGAQIFVHRMGPHPTPIRIENTEVRNSGQAFRLGRYSIHFHLSASMAGSYVRACSIHHTFNRAITAHGVHDLIVEGNVAYDVMGHTYFVEDGIETNNTYLRNLGVLTRGSSSLLNTDQIPATFWITNPNNTFIGNAAAASRAYGFWYDLDDLPSGASRTGSVCPNKTPFGEFRDNVAHTCNEFGLRVWETYIPYVDGCGATEPDTATLYDFVSYGNGIHGLELSVVGHVRLVRFKVADNVQNGMEIQETLGTWGGPMIRDSLIISHTTANTGRPTVAGLKTPNTPRLTVSNVTFVNFDQPGTTCLKACSHCKVRQGGFQVWFQQLAFLGGSEQRKTGFQWEHEVLYRDLDGTLTGQPGGGWVLPNSDLAPPQHCASSVPEFSVNSTVANGTVCSSDVNFLRMAWNRAQPLETLEGVDVNVTNRYGSSLVPWRHYRLTHLDGYMLTMPDREEHTVDWLLPIGNEVDTTFYSAGVYGLRPSSRLWINHTFVQLPDHILLGGNFEPTEHLDTPTAQDPNLSWHIDNVTNEVTYLVSGSNFTDPYSNDVTYDYRYEPCPRDGCVNVIDFGGYESSQRVWSDPGSWPNGRLPAEGDDVTIAARWRMLLDVSPPPLASVYVLGELLFEDEADLNFTANLILILSPNGRLIVGTEEAPHQHRVAITLTGLRRDPSFPLDRFLVLGSKAIGVFGNMSLHGVSKRTTWTRLEASALANSTTLTLSSPLPTDWLPGEEVVIAPSGWDPKQSEIRTITTYNRQTGVLTFDTPLQFDHVVHRFLEDSDLDSASSSQQQEGVGEQWWGDGGSLAPEVGLLTRSIVVQGGEDPSEPQEIHHYGCRLLVAEFTSNDFTYSGRLELDSVEFRYCGQGGYFSPRDPRYAVAFRNSFDSAFGSYVRKCSFHHNYNTAIGLHTSNGIELAENVIWRTVDSGVKVGGRDNRVLGNLAMLTSTIQPNRPPDNHAVDFPATFDIDGGSNEVRGNAAAGSTRIAFRYGGERCREDHTAPTYDEAKFWDNTAHTGLIGLVVLGLPDDCTAVGGFTATHQWSYGVFSSIASSLAVTHLRIGVGKIGLNLNLFGPSPIGHFLGGKFIDISDSLLVGSLPGEMCVTTAPSYLVVAPRLRDHTLGVMMSSFNQRRSKMDGTGMWHLMKGYPVIDGVVTTNRLTFARFFTSNGCSYRSYAVGNNPLSPDAVHPMVMAATFKLSVDLTSLVYFYEPNVEWIVQEDCVDMDCDGPKHALIRDTDGRFVGTSSAGSEGSVVPRAEIRFDDYVHRVPVSWLAVEELTTGAAVGPADVVDHMGVARGDPSDPSSGCEWRADWHAYRCQGLQHHMLVIESLDEDTETRRLSPLALVGGDTGSGEYTDLLNGPMDHGWCTYYTCLKRLSTFFSIVAVGTDYCLWMTGSPPSTIRFHLLNAGPSDSIRLCMWFSGTQRKDVYKNGVFIEPANVEYLPEGGVQQLDGDHVPGRGEMGGANYFDRQSQTMHLVLRGSDPVEIRTPPVVQISLELAVSLDDFFEVGQLIRNLAFVLRIDPSRIRLVEIVAEDSPVRLRRRSVEGGGEGGTNMTTVTLEFGNPPAVNISTPQPPTVAMEIANAGETNDSVDIEDHTVTEQPLNGSDINPLNADPPEDAGEFVERLNISALEYSQSVGEYEEVLLAVEEANSLGEMVVNLVLTGGISNVTNSTVVGLSVIPATPPPAPVLPVVPPAFENSTDEEGGGSVIEEIIEELLEETVTLPPLVVEGEEGEGVIEFVIPTEMRVSMEPLQETGHLVHVALTILDSSGAPVRNLGLVNPWTCQATLLHSLRGNNAPVLGGVTSVPFVEGVAVFTRLRVDRPAGSLALHFTTEPARFEATTSVLFTVVAPPADTAREEAVFVLQGDFSRLPLDQSVVREAVISAVSSELDVDLSRIADLKFAMSQSGLLVEFSLLERQPTDPPDVPSLDTSLATLSELLQQGSLVIYIGGEPYTAVERVVTTPTPQTPFLSTRDVIIIAVAVGGGAVLVALVVIYLCVWWRMRGSVSRRKRGTKDRVKKLSTSVTHLDGSSFRDDDSGVELELASRNSSSDRDVARQQAPLPHAVHEDKGEGLGRRAHHQQQQQQQKPFHFSDGEAVFSNEHADCWEDPIPNRPLRHSSKPHPHSSKPHPPLQSYHARRVSPSQPPITLAGLAQPGSRRQSGDRPPNWPPVAPPPAPPTGSLAQQPSLIFVTPRGGERGKAHVVKRATPHPSWQ